MLSACFSNRFSFFPVPPPSPPSHLLNLHNITEYSLGTLSKTPLYKANLFGIARYPQLRAAKLLGKKRKYRQQGFTRDPSRGASQVFLPFPALPPPSTDANCFTCAPPHLQHHNYAPQWDTFRSPQLCDGSFMPVLTVASLTCAELPEVNTCN